MSHRRAGPRAREVRAALIEEQLPAPRGLKRQRVEKASPSSSTTPPSTSASSQLLAASPSPSSSTAASASTSTSSLTSRSTLSTSSSPPLAGPSSDSKLDKKVSANQHGRFVVVFWDISDENTSRPDKNTIFVCFQVNDRKIGEGHLATKTSKQATLELLRERRHLLELDLENLLHQRGYTEVDRIDCLFALPYLAKKRGIEVDVGPKTKTRYRERCTVGFRLRIVSDNQSDSAYYANEPRDETYPGVLNSIASALETDPRRCIVSFTPETRRRLGFPDITMSLASILLDGYQPPEIGSYNLVPTLITKTQANNKREEGEGSHGRVTAAMGKQLIESWQAKMLVDAAFHHSDLNQATLWLESHVADWAATSMRFYLHVNSLDPPSWTVRSSRDDSPMPCTQFWDTAVIARKQGEELVKSIQRRHGRDHLSSPIIQVQIQERWVREFIETEAHKWGIAAIGGMGQVRVAAASAKPCTGPSCPGPGHWCPGSSGEYLHPADAVIPCSEMCGACCRAHAEYATFQAHPKLQPSAFESWVNDIVKYDAHRGIDTQKDTVRMLAHAAPLTIYGGLRDSHWPVDEVQTILRSQDSLDSKVAALVQLAPQVLSREILTCQPGNVTQQVLAGQVLGAFQAVTLSVDLWRQHADWPQGDLSVQNHNLTSCRMIPTWMQKKRTQHPFMMAAYLASLHVTQSALSDERKYELTAQIQRLLEHAREISQAYSRAHSTGKSMDPKLADLSNALINLLEVREPDEAELLGLVPAEGALIFLMQGNNALLPHTGVPWTPNIEQMLKLYNQFPAQPPKFLPAADKDSWHTLRYRLTQEKKRVERLTNEEVQAYGAAFGNVVASISTGLQVLIEVNDDGLPVTFWPGATSHQILLLAFWAYVRAVLECDVKDVEVWCWDVSEKGWWLLIIVWTLHIARHGRRDPHSGLRLDVSGAGSSPMKPTLCAHITHARPFFEPQLTHMPIEEATLESLENVNACVQPWQLNSLIGSYRISKILATVRQSKSGSMTLLRRLATQHVLDITEAEVEAIASREQLLLPDSLEALRRNGMHIWEA
ncbi:unnamed protein product [Sympodiomycopsis kandeliae]